MQFSVIVPFLNEAPYIKGCAESLLSQDFERNEYEIIFVDNGSTDASAQILANYPGITVIRETKKYEFAARNAGLRVAKGVIIACTNADCLVPRGWLSRIYNGFKDNNASIVFGKTLFVSRNNALLKIFEDYENAKLEYVFKNCDARLYFANANNMAIKARVFKQIGNFADWYRGGDTELLHRYIVFDPSAEIRYFTDVKVEHLEIDTVFTWLKKISVNAENNIIVQTHSNYKPLGIKAKVKIYNYSCAVNGYGIIRKAASFMLLIIGNLFYKIGELRGAYKARFIYKM